MDSVPPENEINTAKRLLKIGFAPVDWLYSESLTKSTKKVPIDVLEYEQK
jgi:hypothetical protein